VLIKEKPEPPEGIPERAIKLVKRERQNPPEDRGPEGKRGYRVQGLG